MGLSTLPPLKAVRIPSILAPHPHPKRKCKTSRHHYLLKMRKEESLRMRRLGSGLLEHDVLDSSILTHLVSLLESQRGLPFVLGGLDVQDRDGSLHVSDHSVLNQRPSQAIPGTRPLPGRQTSRGTFTTSEGRDFPEEGPAPAGQDVSTDTSVQLPPISRHQPLSPIKDVSRDTSRFPTFPALPKEGQEEGGGPTVQVMPATPQHSTLAPLPTIRHQHQYQPNDTEPCMSEASGNNLTSDSSVAADPSLIFGPRSSRRSKASGWKRQQGVKNQSGSNGESPSLRGSMIMAPDGEIIHVGGSIAPLRQHDVGDLRDVTSRLRLYDGGSVVTEQDIVDTLTEQARQIADALLETDGAGAELERDIREAADMWMESHPARDISRNQSVQDALTSGALEELMAAYRDSSDDPTAAEYRHLIRQSLITAVAIAAGLPPEQIPEDLEISADLLEALANQKLSPDDIFIAYDEVTGRPIIKSRLEMQQSNAYSFGQDTGEQMDRMSLANRGTDDASRSEELASAVNGALPGGEYGQKSGEKAGLPVATLRDPADRQGADRTGDAFLPGSLDRKADLSKLATAASASEGKGKKKGVKKKGKKGKRSRKEEDSAPDTEGDSSPAPTLTKAKAAALSASDEALSAKSDDASSPDDRTLQSSPESEKSDDNAEVSVTKDVEGESSSQKLIAPEPFPEDEDEDEEDDDDDSEEKPQANREARAARRAAAAAKRKEEVERRRREREELMKLTKGELERQELLKREMEMERLRREEEKMLRKVREEEDADREMREEEEERRRRLLEEEKERKAKEEYRRKLEEMRREQMEDDERRKAFLLEKEREDERRRAEEELMLSQMAEQERREYEQRKREEEEARKRKEEDERRQREEEAQRAMEEAKRLAEEMARKQAALEAKLRFNRSLRREARHLGYSHDINRAFVFSYFQLMQWLGLDLPQFELAKMRRY